jgi:hypothetical protein
VSQLREQPEKAQMLLTPDDAEKAVARGSG